MKIYAKLAVGIIIFIIAIFIHTTCFAKTVTVYTDTLKLRDEPSTDSAVIRLLSIGDKLTYIEEVEGWVKIKFEGSTGYVSKDYVKIEGEEKPEEIPTGNDEQKPTEAPTQKPAETPTDNSKPNSEEGTTGEQTPATNNEHDSEGETNSTTNSTKSYQVKSETTLYILPLINSSKLVTIKENTNCNIITEQNGWVYIQTDEIDAWARKDNIIEIDGVSKDNNNPQNEPGDDEQTPETPDTNNNTNDTTSYKEKTMYVSEDSIFVRSGAGTNFEIVEYLSKDDKVTVTGEEGDWYIISIDGKKGYVAKWLLTENAPTLTSRSDVHREEAPAKVEETAKQELATSLGIGEQVVEYAKQFLGLPYVYGGSGPKNFDCSGFTMYVYKNFGVSLTHSATAQSLKGTYVAKENLQPGDLVFFKDYETMEGIGHCGIYIGEGNFIHASSGTGYCVKISTLLTGSYNTRYETAKRII